MTTELTVVIKDGKKTLKEKFLVYEPFTLDSQDPLINRHVESVLQNFQGEAEDIVVKALMVVR